jgi:GTP-binding protein HflX
MDASDPTCDEQLKVTQSVLQEIGADSVSSLVILNKADRLDDSGRTAILARHPDGFMMSAKSAEDVAALRQRIVDHFASKMQEADLFIPYSMQGRLGEIYEQAQVLSETYDEQGARMVVRALPAIVARLQQIFGQ